MKVGGLQSPCFKCDKRHIGCHSKCEKYKSYKDCVEEFKSNQAPYTLGDAYIFAKSLNSHYIQPNFKEVKE